MLTVHEAMERLQDDTGFTSWKSSNPDSYLCHCLCMLGDEDAWHIGYSNKDQSMMTFVITRDDITQESSEEVFKKPETEIKPLDFSNVDLTASQAVALAKEFQKKEYPQEVLSKYLIVLQHLDVGQVYNLTFVTLAMSTLNIKVDCKTGDILSHKRTTLMDFKK